jgi:hypothetical protein
MLRVVGINIADKPFSVKKPERLPIIVKYSTLDAQLIDELVTFGLVCDFIALNFEKMCDYQRKCIQYWNSCNESHQENVGDCHFTENGEYNRIHTDGFI